MTMSKHLALSPTRSKFRNDANESLTPIHKSSSKSASYLPPRPTRSRSIVTSYHCSSLSRARSSDNSRASNTYPVYNIDSYVSDTRLSTSREKLRDAVFRRRKSLTLPEFSFLENLLTKGSDEHLEQARHTLNNDELFFDLDSSSVFRGDNDKGTKSGIIVEGQVKNSVAEIRKSMDKRLEKDTVMSDFPQKTEISLSGRYSDVTGISYNKLMYIVREDGTIAVQKYKKTLVDKGDDSASSDLKNSETLALQKYLKSLDIYELSGVASNDFYDYHGDSHSVNAIPSNFVPLGKCPISMGSQERQSHIAERRQSAVHGNMWRAHQSGFALTHAASLYSIGKTKLHRSASFQKGQSNFSRRHSRTSSILTQGILDLVENGGLSANKAILGSIFRPEMDSTQQGGRRPPHSRSCSVSIKKRNNNMPECNISGTGPLDDSECYASLRRAESVSYGTSSPIPSIRYVHPLRSSSDVSSNGSSVPGIQHASLIRGESSASSVLPLESITQDDFKNISDLWLNQPPFSSNQTTISEHRGISTKPAWSAPLHQMQVEPIRGLMPNPKSKRPILMREASQGNYGGVGVEVAELDNNESAEAFLKLEPLDKARRNSSLLSSYISQRSLDDSFFTPSSSLIDTTFYDLEKNEMKRSLSHDEMTTNMAIKLHNPVVDLDSLLELPGETYMSKSWDLESDEGELKQYDAWNVFIDEYAVGYGYRGLPFQIIGTSADDEDSRPHVLSPPMMESLYSFLPYSVAEQNFWMKYSLIRDGASFHTMLQQVRGSPHTIMAIETTDGEVFGSFTSRPWRKRYSYFGTGESFLWRMRQTRKTPSHSIIDQAQLESEIDVFLWSGKNNCIQVCTSDKIAVGGGSTDTRLIDSVEQNNLMSWEENGFEQGFGLVLETELLHGTSCFCSTFDSPPLSKEHVDGSPFEIVNIEVWTMTPAMSVEESEKLEFGRLFLEKHRSD